MDDPTTESADTQRLIEQVRAGDRSAMTALLERNQAYLRRLVELRLDPKLRSRVDPSDILQEAHLEATRRLDDYLHDPVLPFRLWLRQLALDRVIMLRRFHLGAARRAVGREVLLPEESSVLLAQQLAGPGTTPSEQVNQRQLAERVNEAVAQLPEADREILLLRTFEGLSFDDVACLLKVEPATARKRHGRALLRLHKILSEGGLTESQL